MLYISKFNLKKSIKKNNSFFFLKGNSENKFFVLFCVQQQITPPPKFINIYIYNISKNTPKHTHTNNDVDRVRKIITTKILHHNKKLRELN